MNKFEDWLKLENIPQEIIEVLLDQNFPYGKEIGTVRFDKPDRIMENEDWAKLISNKMLSFGDALNGDLWAFDWMSGETKIVIIAAAEIGNSDDEIMFSELVWKVADSFEQFMELAKKDKLPLDYYEAKDTKFGTKE